MRSTTTHTFYTLLHYTPHTHHPITPRRHILYIVHLTTLNTKYTTHTSYPPITPLNTTHAPLTLIIQSGSKDRTTAPTFDWLGAFDYFACREAHGLPLHDGVSDCYTCSLFYVLSAFLSTFLFLFHEITVLSCLLF